MKILGFRTIRGPNVYHPQPVIIMKVDLEQWTDRGSHELPGFNDRLVQMLPGLSEHTCSPGYVGGFLERLDKGTYLAHIIEHIAIELSSLAGSPISYGKTRYAGRYGHYDIIVRWKNEEGMKMSLQSAFDLAKSILENTEFEVSTKVDEIKRTISQTQLGPSAQALWDAAQRRGIPVRRLGDGSLLQLGYGKYRRRVQTAVSDRTGLIAADLVQDKQLTKTFLEEAAIPVPQGSLVSTEEELLRVIENFAGPYAIKPFDGHHGQGVVLDLKTREDIFKAFYAAKEFSSSVIIEEMCPGRDYRVLVIGGRFSAAAERTPPKVVGDGERTVQVLLDQLNQDPRRGEGHGSILTRVQVDDTLIETLRKQGLQLGDIPENGRTVLLRANANLSSGGTAKDVTDTVHPEVKALCERISRVVDLDICGVDIIAQDLSLPLNSFFKVIEVNAGPGLRMHLSPTEGEVRKVGDDIVQTLYPMGTPSRIPIVAVTGTNGKTTTVRLIHKILSNEACVGLTTSDGVYIGNQKITSGDTTGPASAQIVLSDPAVEEAVLEVARGGLLKRGLAYDWSDVGVITNIRPDHIGQDGIESIEDLFWIKSVVAERVKEGGTIVLNADDEQAIKLKDSSQIQKIPRNILLYSVQSRNLILEQHIRAGGDAAWSEEGFLYLQMQKKVYKIVATHDLKFAFEGKATFQVSNALAAVGASAAMGATAEQIMNGLVSFQPATENRGRLNLYKVGEGHVILDYGHNPDAISALGEFLSQWKGYKKTAVFGLPGDRTNEILEMSAEKMAQIFERMIIRDDHDLRGRNPGEVPALIEKMVKSRFPYVQFFHAENEKVSIETSLDPIRQNEIVVIFYDIFDSVMPLIRQYDPVPVSTIPDLETVDESSVIHFNDHFQRVL